MSGTRHGVHNRERFLKKPTLQLQVSLSSFHVCVSSVPLLAAVGQLLLTSSKQYVRKPSFDEDTNTPSAEHRPAAFPHSQCGITHIAIPILNNETYAVNGHGIEAFEAHHARALKALLVQRPNWYGTEVHSDISRNCFLASIIRYGVSSIPILDNLHTFAIRTVLQHSK